MIIDILQGRGARGIKIKSFVSLRGLKRFNPYTILTQWKRVFKRV